MEGRAPLTRESQRRVLLEARDVSKRYGSHVALSAMSIHLHAGEITALMGENGAGKSTLAKILTGALQPDTGSIVLDGSAVSLKSPRAAIEHGIVLIPQELASVPELTAAENIVLANWPTSHGLTNQRTIRERAGQALSQLGITLDLNKKVRDLKLADRQLVEIVKAISRGAQVLVLDEPTAALSKVESDLLFQKLNQMTDAGIGILFISHHLDEIEQYAQRALILRNGELALSGDMRELTRDRIVEEMIGAEMRTAAQKPRHSGNGRRIALTNVTHRRTHRPLDVGIDLAYGEVTVLFGLRGAGQDEIAEGLGGLVPELSGSLDFGDGRTHAMPSTPRQARRLGVAYLPAERKRNGLVLSMATTENIALPTLSTFATRGLVRRSRLTETARRYRDLLKISLRSVQQSVAALSGGNQQKVLFASRMHIQSRLYVLHEPTRGVDVGARFEIHEQIRRLAEEGQAILVVSSDVEEAAGLADCVFVLVDGHLREQSRGDDISQMRLLQSATRG